MAQQKKLRPDAVSQNGKGPEAAPQGLRKSANEVLGALYFLQAGKVRYAVRLYGLGEVGL